MALKLLSLCVLAALVAMETSAAEPAFAAPPSASRISLESQPSDPRISGLQWVLTVRNHTVPGHPPAAAHDVVVRITATANNREYKPYANLDVPSSGYIDLSRGEWVIPFLPPNGSAEAIIRPQSFIPYVRDQELPFRMHAELVEPRYLASPAGDQGSVETEWWYVRSANSIIKWPGADVGVQATSIPPSPAPGTETTFQVFARNYRYEYDNPRIGPSKIIAKQWDVQIKIDLSPGLSFGPGLTAPTGTSFDAESGIWDVGVLSGFFGPLTLKSLSIPVLIDADDVVLERLCLTATVVKATPPFAELDPLARTNDVDTVCLGKSPLLTSGEIILWRPHDCVGVTTLPCGTNDDLKLFARTKVGNNMLSGIRVSGDIYLDPQSFIIQVLDPRGRVYDRHADSITAATTVSWQTGRKDSGAYNHDGVTLQYSQQGFNANISDWDNLTRTVAVSGLDGATAPGRVRVRFDGSFPTTYYDPYPTYTRSPVNLTSPANWRTDMFFEFDTLGTYVVSFSALATRTDNTPYTASGDYTFHVGPIAELAVRDARVRSPLVEPGRWAYTILAENNGPNTAPDVQVTLTDVPQGAEAFFSDGTYQEVSCQDGLCRGVWDLGELPVSITRPSGGRLPFPTLTLITDADAPANIQASIRNTKDYTVCIDSDGRNVIPKPASDVACEATSGNSWHSTNYFDYDEENDEATIAALPGTGEGAPGTPRSVRVRTYPDPPFAIVSWDRVERLNGWDVDGYEVHASAPPCERPAFDATASATVRERVYFDTSPPSGEATCYAVRAVNVHGVTGHWPHAVSTDAGGSLGGGGVTLSKSSLTVTENGGTGSYTVVLDRHPSSDVRVRVSSADTGAARVSPAELTFTPSTWNVPQRVTVTGVDDDIANTNGWRSALIQHSASGGGYDNVSVPTVRVSVSDDDRGPSEVSLSVTPARMAEDDGPTRFTVTAEIEGDVLFAEEKRVVVNIQGSGQPDRVQFEWVRSFEIVIPFGSRSGSATFTLTPRDDDIDQGFEQIAVVGGLPGTAVSGATIILEDDDGLQPGVVALSVDPDTVVESAARTRVRVTATVEGPLPRKDSNVRINVGGGTAEAGTDYAAVDSFTITIPAGEATATGHFWLDPVDDGTNERDETILVAGAPEDGVDTFATVRTATVTLKDVGRPGSSISLTANPSSLMENEGRLLNSDGETAVRVTATVNGSPVNRDTQVRLDVRGITAVEGTDYRIGAVESITIPAGETSGSAWFRLTPLDNDAANAAKTIRVSGSASVRVHEATITLKDDDGTPVREAVCGGQEARYLFGIDTVPDQPGRQGYGEARTFTVKFSQSHQPDGGSPDLERHITFAPGETVLSVSVPTRNPTYRFSRTRDRITEDRIKALGITHDTNRNPVFIYLDENRTVRTGPDDDVFDVADPFHDEEWHLLLLVQTVVTRSAGYMQVVQGRGDPIQALSGRFVDVWHMESGNPLCSR